MRDRAEQQIALRKTWTAILLAGQRPGPDPLALHFGQHYKALVPVCGVPMVERVAACLLRVPEDSQIVVLAQEPEVLLRGTRGWLERQDKVSFFVSEAGIAESILSFLASAPDRWPVLVTTADHPLLTPEIVQEFLKEAGNGDLAVGVVERRTVMRRYPETRRTWLKFADGAYSGANLFALRTGRVEPALELWRRAERDRKQAIRLFWHFGPWLACRAILRLIGFRDGLAEAGRRLGLDARLVELQTADAAVDVDKLSDHRLAEQIIAGRDRIFAFACGMEGAAALRGRGVRAAPR